MKALLACSPSAHWPTEDLWALDRQIMQNLYRPVQEDSAMTMSSQSLRVAQ